VTGRPTRTDPPLTLAGLLLASAAAHPDADALVWPDRRLSHAALRDRATQWARAFVALGVQPGDHVGLLLHTCPEFVEAMFGAALAGAAVVPINARYQPGELAYCIENADLSVVVTAGRLTDGVDFHERLLMALPSLARVPGPHALHLPEAPLLRAIVTTGVKPPPGVLSARDALAAGASVPAAQVEDRATQVAPEALALILYTSGTTAAPKGCMITQRAMVANARALGERYRLSAADRFWSPLPIFHIAGILPLVAVLDAGGAYLTVPHFEPGEALNMLARERATVAYPCFVTIMQDLIGHPSFATTDLASVRLMNANFAVQPDWIAEAMVEAMPHTVMVGTYGLTEGAGTICTSRIEDPWDARPAGSGAPLPGWEVRIVDPETGAPVPLGGKGEIEARGPGMLTGYYRAPEKTAETLTADGWMRTGDLGSLDEAGQIMFHGRTKDMLKVGGENVAAAEIEAALASHPAVKLAQVVSAPHPRLQEVPAAFIELMPGARVSPEELVAHCTGRIASFKLPRHVRFVTEWPMSTSKIQKFRLREMLAAELAAGARAA
jgi:acyl-CoA synthetase (AMP-forming)/AMP-acid ligase II